MCMKHSKWDNTVYVFYQIDNKLKKYEKMCIKHSNRDNTVYVLIKQIM